MKTRSFYFSTALIAAIGTLSGDPVPQQQMSFTAGAADTWNADWLGESGRTYFFEWSQNLTQWNYAPFVDFGSGVKSFGVATQNAPTFFVRLHYVDDAAVTSLQQAREADFDNDGIPNYWEAANGLNPMSALGNDGATGDLDGDGFNNLREYYLESNPNDINDRPKGMVAAKDLHSVSLTADGRVWSWGYNSSGELGDGTTASRNTPVPLAVAAGMTKILRIDTGRYFSLALDDNGALWAWGYNGNHQISKDATYQFKTPVRIDLPAPVTRFACGSDHVLAVDRNGRLWSWGYNANGQLGLGHTNPVSGAVEITKPSGMGVVLSVAASGNASYAVDAAGKMWSWGYNGDGQLGDGTNTNRNAPVAVDTSTGVSAIKSIVSGESHAMASAVDGSIWTWGYNGYGQLGRGNTTGSNKPVKLITGLVIANGLGAGANHSLAVSPSGFVWGWGRNDNGQLGTNSTSSSYSPLQTTAVSGGSDMVQVAGGSNHSLALKKDGSIWSWGYNSNGQLGLGDNTQRVVSTQITNLKLADDDSDSDGLPDSWERFYFGNLLQTGTGVYVSNGVTNLVAYAKGLNPTVADNDNDGISDAVELAAGLDPLDWSDATGDLDGDRIPNLWEAAMGSSMTDPASKPTVTATVSAGQSIQTAINAVVANSSNPTWAIIQVQPGVYSENINLPYDKRILLIPASTSGIPEIQGAISSATVSINGESVIDGFRITHAKGVAGAGVVSSISSGRALARIVNCLVYGHSGSSGNGIYETNGRLVIANCSVFRNSASSQGNGLYVGSNARTVVMNSIFWNPTGQASEEVYSSGITEIRQTIIRDGSIAGALTEDPLLNPLGMLTQVSPARNKGTSKALAFRDIQGEARGPQPDIGADQFIDTDNDGLPDWLETLGVTSAAGDNDTDGILNLDEYEINGTNPLVADTDGDGLNDGGELAAGTNPFDPDTDTDGIRDGWEVQYGLNPLDDRDALSDQDGDRVPNLWEYKRGTVPTNSGSRPAADWIVNPALAGTANNVATIQQAINNAPTITTNPAFYAVIEVRRGVYAENVSIPSSRKITLLGELGYPLTEIRSAANSSYSIDIGGEAFVDGFRISRSKDADDLPYNGNSGIYVSTSAGTGQVSLSNLLIHGHRTTYGGGIYCANGRLRLIHSTIYDTGAQYSGNAIYFGSSASLDIQNCIIRGGSGVASQQIYKSTSAIVNASGSFIQGGEFGGNSADPMLTPAGWLRKNSPAINFGLPSLVPRDINNELRAGNPDAGADEFIDTDTDGLPDWLETLGATSPSVDNDTDGLSNLTEYEISGSNPLVTDTDGDGLNDGAEASAGSNPFDTDTDNDGMPDGWEVQYGLNPTNDQDALQDQDGDRVPNVYEFANGTFPNLASSVPAPHITVDPAVVTETSALKKTIQNAINDSLNANRHTIIRVKPGIYPESLNIDSKRILLLGDLGTNFPVIAPTSGDAVRIYEKSAVLDGFVIRRGATLSTDRGLYIYTDLDRDQARIVNCTISGFSANSGSAAYLGKGKLTVAHCTIMDNSSTTNGRAFEIYTGRLILQNSIVWNPTGAASEQIYQYTPGTATAITSIILGGELGSISTAPMMDRYYCLMPGSPALGAGTPLPVSSLDRHGEPRPAVAPDIGADQYLDSDSDSLPDWWEKTYFGNLTKASTDDNDTPTLDRLTNNYEYLLGFDPTKSDSLSNGNGDLFNAVFGSVNDPWYPSDWRLDPDGDGLTNGQELYYGTAPLTADSNGDGISDKAAIQAGISATSLDTDGDGISNAQEILNGTNPLLVDTDGDGVADNLDPFPTDPSRWIAPTTASGDVTPPQIVLITPENATPL